MTDTLIREELEDLTLEVDPRIAQRRADVEQAHRHRQRSWWFCALSAAMLLAVVGVIGLRSTFFDVHTIRVTGARHAPIADVRAAAGVRPDSSMFDIDGAAAVRRIERLPWVASASVRRQWPSTVVIELHEYDATASLPLPGGRARLVSRQGRVVAEVAASEVPPGVVAINGVDLAPPVGGTIYPPVVGEVGPQLPEGLRGQLDSVDLGGSDVVLRLHSGVTVNLGTAEQVGAQLRVAAAVLANPALRPCTTTVDVSVAATPTARC